MEFYPCVNYITLALLVILVTNISFGLCMGITDWIGVGGSVAVGVAVGGGVRSEERANE